MSRQNITRKSVKSGFNIYLTDEYNLSNSYSLELYPTKGKRWKTLPQLNEQRK